MKKIVITGASRGIGEALALEFLKNPDTMVYLISRDEQKLEEIKDEAFENDDRIFIYPFDLVSDNYDELMQKFTRDAGTIDILINNAGSLVNKPFIDITLAEFDKVFDTNVKGPFILIKHLIPIMKQGSHIVNISSMGGFQGSAKFPGLSIYSASKGALSILSECLATELESFGISVNCLALGSVQTTMLEQAFPGFKAQVTPESVAEYISYFALNANKWLNGKVLPVSLSTP